MNCVVCKTELTNGLDTYGDIGREMCWECWSTLEFECRGHDEPLIITADIFAADAEDGTKWT